MEESELLSAFDVTTENSFERTYKRGSEFTDARSGLSATALSTADGEPAKLYGIFQ